VPSSLRLILLLCFLSAVAAPISVALIHAQDVHAARTNAEQMTHGNAERGKAAIQRYGCDGCHEIEGLPVAAGQVGPPLAGIASRAEIAGTLPNLPSQMVLWLRYPQRVLPGNGMPQMSVTEADARDLAAYLYTLRKSAS
jgi:cytochrome c2